MRHCRATLNFHHRCPKPIDTFRYTSQRQIANLGLYNYGARYYDPHIGRFISADAIVPNFANPQSLNRFAYVLNNPLKYIDPTGHTLAPSYCSRYPAECQANPATRQTSYGAPSSGGNASTSSTTTSTTGQLTFCQIYVAECQFASKGTSNGSSSAPGVQIRTGQDGKFDPGATWGGLTVYDLLARMILSEESNKILDFSRYKDAVGIAWVARNRASATGVWQIDTTTGKLVFLNSVLGSSFGQGYKAAILAPNQFLGMLDSGHASWAADPQAYPRQFGSAPDSGTRAYNIALSIATGVIDGTIPDPTNGAQYYADAYLDRTQRDRTAFWKAGNNDYANSSVDPHLTIPELVVKYGGP